jgi:hypothetical protein
MAYVSKFDIVDLLTLLNKLVNKQPTDVLTDVLERFWVYAEQNFMGNTVTELWVQERDKLGKKDEELEACDDKQFEDLDVNSDSGKKDEELVTLLQMLIRWNSLCVQVFFFYTFCSSELDPLHFL